eukprot:3085759-Rhodomonas_salina.1
MIRYVSTARRTAQGLARGAQGLARGAPRVLGAVTLCYRSTAHARHGDIKHEPSPAWYDAYGKCI